LALQAAHSLASECRSGLQTARRCCLFYALRPASFKAVSERDISQKICGYISENTPKNTPGVIGWFWTMTSQLRTQRSDKLEYCLPGSNH
jgi:hypothetical protein